jgi:hypothetical protein
LFRVQDAAEHGKLGQSEERAIYEVPAIFTCLLARRTKCNLFSLFRISCCGLVSARGHVGDDRFGVLWLQEGAGGLGDFCTITIDGSGGLSEDILQQRLQSVARQREELQQVEIELRAQAIAHPQIIEAQQSFQAAAKEHAAAVAKIKVVLFALSSVFLYQYPAQIRV